MDRKASTCKNCGTKVFKSPEEFDQHHKEGHEQSPDQKQDNESKPTE